MFLSPLTSNGVKAFLSVDTWTEVILISSKTTINSVYFVTTEDKLKKRKDDSHKIEVQSSSYEKVKDFIPWSLVAVEIDGNWFRGKLISYNEYQQDDTWIELIDCGSMYQTKLKDLYILPYYLLYEPLCLPIKFKNFVPKEKYLKIKALLTESELYEGYVFVNVLTSEISQKKVVPSILVESRFKPKNEETVLQLTNGYCNGVSDLHSLPCLRKGSFNNTIKQDIPLKNGDKCCITYFDDYNAIYVVKTENKRVIGVEIVEKTVFCKDTTPKLNPVVGDVVKVFSQQYKMFFRAKVLKPLINNKFEVIYIDYGNLEVVSSDNIYILPDDLVTKPGLAIRVGINAPAKIKKTPAIEKMFEQFANDCEIFKIEFNETAKNCLDNVKLINEKSEQSISVYIKKLLPDDKDVKRTSSIALNTENKNLISDLKITNSEVKENLNILKNGDSVFIKHFEDSANVFVIKNCKCFNQLMIDLIEDKTLVSQSNLQRGDLVKVVTSDTQYRAKVLDLKNDMIVVMNIDFGNIDNVSADCIYELSSKLKEVPQQIIKIGLKGPIIKPTAPVLKFIEDIEKIKYNVELDEKNSNDFQEITLKRDNLKISIIDELMKVEEQNLTNYDLKKSSKIERSMLKSGDYCIITYFEDFDCIYIGKAKKDNNDIVLYNYNLILEVMQSKGNQLNVVEPKVGEFYKIFSKKFDMTYYRGKVLKKEDTNRFKVYYIDFGNTEVVELKCVFELEDKYKEMIELPAPYAFKIPKMVQKTDEITNIFNNLIIQCCPLIIELEDVTNDGTLQYVKLKYVENSRCVNDEIIKKFKIERPLKNGDVCILTFFQNFKNVFVNKAIKNKDSEQWNLENEDMIVTIMSSAVSTDDLEKNLKIGDIVKVFSLSDKAYYRGKILSQNNDYFNVFYIDFGNTENVFSNQIFQLSDDFKNKSGSVIRIGLNVNINIVNDTIKNIFSEYIDGGIPLLIEYDELSEDGFENCVLKILSSGINLNDVALNAALESSNYEQNQMESLNVNNKTELEKAIIKFHDEQPTFVRKQLSNNENVIIRYFHDTKNIFVSKDSEKEMYHQLVFDVINNKDLIKENNIQVGSIIKTYFDEQIFRAKILEIMSNGVKVKFIDFGNEEIVSESKIFQLPEKQKSAEFIYKIGIKGYPLVSKNDKIENFIDELSSEDIYIVYDENNPDGLQEASLRYKKNHIDIFEILFKNMGVSINKQESFSKLEYAKKNENEIVSRVITEFNDTLTDNKLKNGDIVYCSHFENFHDIFLCKGSLETKVPNNYDVVVNSADSHGLNVITYPKIQDIVKVKFEDDYLRSKIIEQVDNESYKVFFIDVGKTVTVNSNNIFELADELKMIPGLAIKAGLKNTKNIELTNCVRQYFENLWYRGPIPLVLVCNDNKSNYLFEVSLKNKCSGLDIIEELMNIQKISDVPSVPKEQSSNNHVTSICYQPKSGDKFELISGNNAESIYVRNLLLSEQLKNVIFQLKSEKKENLIPAKELVHNTTYAVYSDRLKEICRAKCLNTVEYRFVISDYAICENLKKDNVWLLPDAYKTNKVPVITSKICLKGVPKNSNLSSYLEKHLKKTFILEFDNTSDRWFKQVTLREPGNKITLNDEILEYIKNLKSQQQRLERKIILPELTQQKEKPTHPIQTGSLVQLTYFKSFNCIFIRNATYEELQKFNEFATKLTVHYRKKKNIVSKATVDIGEKVCVMSFMNMGLYSRAIVLEKSNDGYYVKNIDYGNEECVNCDDIYELDEEFKKSNDFAFIVQLQNLPKIKSENELNVVKNYFQQQIITPNRRLIIMFNDLNPQGLDDVVLRTEYDNKDITDDIIPLLNTPPISAINKLNSTKVNDEMETRKIYPYPARKHQMNNPNI
ncbi:uncharacterized protein LOC126896591 isoform X2 [Daktulosphaira vitifoliae]|uniref:uncharacterized protein LOC126896591 isoform X2 n=1 Tax=Daktulosphaira vitifoliae TaxID=58002 RepID=UPI0021AA1F94|nr:uncharacterized protein LOC126896591 isoform X2 [Daktulosphaira vitifoliae]